MMFTGKQSLYPVKEIGEFNKTQIEGMWKVEEFNKQYQGLLFKLAYEMTGSASDAKDIVEDVLLKAQDVNELDFEHPQVYLCTMVTNRCRDYLTTARRRREKYFGEWLPEPISTANEALAEAKVKGERLSYAMLVLLERLTPTERAVFVLRESMGFELHEIAELLDKSEGNCQRVFDRARMKLDMTDEGHVHPEAASEAWVTRFLKALAQDNIEAILDMLDKDVQLISDGGGKVVAAVYPIESAAAVARFLFGLVHMSAADGSRLRAEMKEINGQPGIVVRSNRGIETVALLHVEDLHISNIYLIRNPDKLNDI